MTLNEAINNMLVHLSEGHQKEVPLIGLKDYLSDLHISFYGQWIVDPIAALLSRDKNIDKLDRFLSKRYGNAQPLYLGSGTTSIVLGMSKNHAARIGLGNLDPVFKTRDVIKPILTKQFGIIRLQIMPRADTFHVKSDELMPLVKSLDKDGYSFHDAHIRNIGKLGDKTVVIDPGAVDLKW